mmetsp:Transcript_80466/g.236671  ORF Transcript_80466/g.236671 Transcript_80466/m.236671 type:complete len:404 (+) Transcript_80466:139-1350(+)
MSGRPQGFVTSVLFPSPPPSYTIDSFPGELVWVPCEPFGARVPECGTPRVAQRCDAVPCLLLLYDSARFLIVFFHSNAEDLGRCRWFCLFLREQFQCHVLAVEYPGYGVCGGSATREGILASARAALDFVTEGLGLPTEQIKIFGRSIGTGPALYLAARHRVAGVILVTPFLSVKCLFRDRVGPLSLLVDEWFSNDVAMEDVASPTMIIHGREDKIIPCRHGEELYRLCQSRKLFISPKSMDHNSNLTSNITYLIMPMFRFFSLPDYSFQELKVPAWAFEKRRSPFFQRPEVEVRSHSLVPQGSPRYQASLCMPEGDEEEEPLDQSQDVHACRLERLEQLQGRARSAAGDSPVEDSEANAVLTNRLVLHVFKPTKERYDFNGGGLADKTHLLAGCALTGGEGL